jgi:hypothetical protein
VRILDPEGPPTFDAGGAVRSVQAAEVRWSPAELAGLWSPSGLARLAGGYWRFLARITLGLIHVRYTATGRSIVLVGRPLVLLSFDPPEYELGDDRAAVRWRIRGGLLLARGGRTRRASFEIFLHRAPEAEAGGRVGAEVRVVGFVPAIARVFGRRAYEATQSRIHVAVTHGFLRSLARPDRLAARPGRPDGG